MAVVVTGLGLVSALGSSVAENWRRLLAGEGAIALRQPFPELPVRPMAMVGKTPEYLGDLLIPAAREAVEDAGLSVPLPECGVVIGSSRGHQAQWEQGLRTGHPVLWLETLPHMGAMAVARQIGSQGAVLAPMAACATGLWAIAQGSLLIQTGQCEQVLVGAGEAAVTPLTLTGFEQMRAAASTGCYPFDRRRQGLALGEGAAMLLLESETAAQQRAARIYGRVRGIGLTADAHHVSAPDDSLQGGLRAICTCLARSSLRAEEIDFIHAHGTGTELNDRYEAALIQYLFPPSVAVSSTKGATGHTLGASGAIGAVFCLLALYHQMLPPTVGLTDPAFALNLVRQPQPQSLETALCLSFGFGGQNAAIAFSR